LTTQRYLIGIDDTDNLESRGTGFRARTLGARLAEAGIGTLKGVSRHQLFVHESIAYTSHNSSLCLDIDVAIGREDELAPFCREFLRSESAPGSDAGLCIAPWESVPESAIVYGRSAKDTVLTRESAEWLAGEEDLLLEGLTGDHGGKIGSLAAVGLRRGGEDGRFVWLKGIREIDGIMPVADLLATTGIEVIRGLDGTQAQASERVRLSEWTRPVLLDGSAVLLVEKPEDNNVEHDWELVAREIVRGY
jgi:hypothetical protein